MSLPGSTAESSLTNKGGHYTTRTSIGPSSEVIPQRINQACWIRAFIRTSVRCINLGYGADLCAETAGDLADSVCDF